ncbi:ATPase [Humibacillus sp. DSM 29435]|uniref:SRPBCC family protein n=1 Tax=Humibacillus sp. DSM 29435 TaxID=1869167 RepID=UPI00087299F4|nr:SRPBCC domain-containing protein [Humibacillus sp. DSM 29435]OFE15609.1 ATPase [Humibacillus sp. DSM 29435]
MAEHATSIEIEAAPQEVFDYLVTPGGMTAWMGQRAVLEPHPGGVFEVDIAGSPIRGEYLEVVPPHRVVVSWGVAGSTDLPPGASTVAFTLSATPRGTRVEVVHSGLPDPLLAGHVDGWAHFLPRLGVAAHGGEAGEDDWMPLAPSLP